MFCKKKSGFTIIELLVVMSIIAILTTVTIVGYMSFIEKAHRSNDEQLVSNLNSVLILEEEESPYSPTFSLNLISELKEKGFNLETESKNVDLFYNVKTKKVELGTITKDGHYQTSYPKAEDVKLSVLNDAEYLEYFIEDRILIGCDSTTGLSKAIYGIRSAKNSDEVKNQLKKLTKYQSINTSLSSYLATSLFVDEQSMFTLDKVLTNETIQVDDLSNQNLKNKNKSNLDLEFIGVKNLIFTSNITILPSDFGSVISNTEISILDLPNQITINQTMVEDLFENLVESNNANLENGLKLNVTIVTSSENLKLINNINSELSSLLTLQKDRDNIIDKIIVNKYYSGSSSSCESFEVDYSKEIRKISLNASQYFLKSNDANVAYDFPVVKVNNQNVEFTSSDGVVWSYVFEDDFDEINTIELIYNKVNPNAYINDCYYTLEIALSIASSNTVDENIIVIAKDTNGKLNEITLERDLIIKYGDTLIIPRNQDDLTGDFVYGAGAQQGGTQVYSKVKLNSTLTCYGNLKIGGYQRYQNGGNATGKIEGSYAELELLESARLVMRGATSENTANLVVGGYIKASSTTEEMQIIMREYSNILARMASEKWYGGSHSTSLATADLFPLTDYSIDGLQCNVQFQHRSQLKLRFGVNMSLGEYSQEMTMISYDDNIKSLLVIKDSNVNGNGVEKGYVNLSYKAYPGFNNTYRSVMDFYGSVDISRMIISVSDFEFDTDNMTLPMNKNFVFNIKEGAVVNINVKQGIKLLPGSEINIENGGTVIMNDSSLFVYEWSTDPTTTDPENSKGYCNYFDFKGSGVYNSSKIGNSPVGLDAIFRNNGLIICNGNCNLSGNFLGAGAISGSYKINGTVKEATDFVSGCITDDAVVSEIYVTRSGETIIPWEAR